MENENFDWIYEDAIRAGVTPEELEASKGPPKCFACKGPQVRRLGSLCPKCDGVRADKERRDCIARAWATFPSEAGRLSFSQPDRPKLASWVKDVLAINAASALSGTMAANPFVTLAGPAGAGKTTLAVVLAKSWVRRLRDGKTPREDRAARTCHFTTAPKLVAMGRATQRGHHVPGVQLATESGLLVLDEVGRGRDHDGIIFDLVNTRLERNAPTIFTTPCATREELEMVLGDGGMARRIFDAPTVLVQVQKL